MNNKRRKSSRIKFLLEETTFVLLMLLMFVIVPGIAGHVDTHYKMECKVINVDGEIITVEDRTGNLWDFCGDGLYKGDAVKVTFFNNTTDSTREDDEIIDVIKM